MESTTQTLGTLSLALVVFLAATPLYAQTTRYVEGTGTNTNNDCTNEAEPCATIGHAIEEAEPGDTIQIAPGAYTETLDVNKSLFFHGASEQATVIQASTVPPGEPGEATERVLTISEGLIVEITDMTIRHGNAANGSGGGIDSNGSSLTLNNVTVHANSAENGCGGMRSTGGSPTLTEVAFIDNSARVGGGMCNHSSSPTLNNVIFSGNRADDLGGGMLNSGSSPTLVNVTFIGNEAGGWEGQEGGGGMFNQSGSSPTLINVAFSGNTTGAPGGAIQNKSIGNLVIQNSIFWNNSDNSGTGTASASIANDDNATPEIAYSLVQGCRPVGPWNEDCGEDAGGNPIDADPLFVDMPNPDDAPTTEGNLRLMEGSPAINASNPDTDLALFPGGPDNPVDLGGDPRVFGDEIDMGAYEWNPNVAGEAGPEETAEVLGTPYPNPTHGSTTFTLAVEHTQHVTVEVFDALGRRVQTLYDGALTSGMAETLTLDASALPAGVYIVRATGDDLAATRRVTVIR